MKPTTRLFANLIFTTKPLHGRCVIPNLERKLGDGERPVIHAPKSDFELFERRPPSEGFNVAAKAFFHQLRKYKKVLGALVLGILYTEKYHRSFDADTEEYLYLENGGLSLSAAGSSSMLEFLGYEAGGRATYSDNILVNKIISVLYAIIPGLHFWMERSGYTKSDFANASVKNMLTLKSSDFEAIERAI